MKIKDLNMGRILGLWLCDSSVLCVSLALGLWACSDETVSGSVLEAHPAAQRWILPQVRVRWLWASVCVESFTHWRKKKLLSLFTSVCKMFLFNISRIEAVTDTGQMGSVIRLKQFLVVRRLTGRLLIKKCPKKREHTYKTTKKMYKVNQTLVSCMQTSLQSRQISPPKGQLSATFWRSWWWEAAWRCCTVLSQDEQNLRGCDVTPRTMDQALCQDHNYYHAFFKMSFFCASG